MTEDNINLESKENLQCRNLIGSSNFVRTPNTENVSHILKDLRVRNYNKVIIGNLNINSIPNKFDQLKTIMQGNIDILVVTETKLDF